LNAFAYFAAALSTLVAGIVLDYFQFFYLYAGNVFFLLMLLMYIIFVLKEGDEDIGETENENENSETKHLLAPPTLSSSVTTKHID